MNAFAGVIGQNSAVELLLAAVTYNRIAPAYLFAGPPGIGRSLTAKCFSELLLNRGTDKGSIAQRSHLKNHPDWLWVEPTYLHQGKLLSATEAAAVGPKRKASPQIRIEQIREISQFLSRPPLEAARSVVVIEDAQMMTEAAANALLKTLEEPGQATLILIAPGTDSLLPTLVSRCQRIPFYRLSQVEMKRILQQSNQAEILQHPEILAIAIGSPGEAIAAFAQLQAIPEEILDSLTHPQTSPLDALTLAKNVAQLDIQAQLWLVNYLQHCYWHSQKNKKLLEHLEKARQCLLSYVQPRLVWECMLLRIWSS